MILVARGFLPPCHFSGGVSLGFASCTVMFSSSMGGDSPAQVGATLTSTSTGTGSSSGAIPATNFFRVDSSIPGERSGRSQSYSTGLYFSTQAFFSQIVLDLVDHLGNGLGNGHAGG